jgi:hypothetical protein
VILGGDIDQSGLNVIRSSGRVTRKHGGDDTSDVGRGHRSTADRLNGISLTDPSGSDTRARSDNVDARTIVGEGCAAVLFKIVLRVVSENLRGGNRDGLGDVGRRSVASVSVLITTSNDNDDALLDGSANNLIKSGVLGSTQRHVQNRSSSALLSITSHKLDSAHDRIIRSRALAVEDLDSDESGVSGNTISLTTDGTSDVSTVTVAILVLVVISKVGTPLGATLELVVFDENTSVNDVSGDTLAPQISMNKITVQLNVALSDAVETPGGLALDQADLIGGLQRGPRAASKVHLVENLVHGDHLNKRKLGDLLNLAREAEEQAKEK